MTPGGWFLGALAVYFALQAALRIALGGALEVDEAEMILLARDWRLGYGPQSPLYNWVQVAGFQVFGLGTAGLAIPKNAVLWLAYAGLFAGLRQVLPFAPAAAGTLSLALLPNVLWEFQRASTHSIALLAAVCWTVAAALLALCTGRFRAYAALGVAVAAGCLAKANFLLVPVALVLAGALWPRDIPHRWHARGLVLAFVVTGMVLAAPIGWAMRHQQLVLASTGKLYAGAASSAPMLAALAQTAGGIVAGLILVMIAAGLLAWSGRSGAGSPSAPRWPANLLLRAGGMALALWLAGAAALNVTKVEARWLVPVLVLLGAGLMTKAAIAASPRALWALNGAAAALGIVTLIGMADLRLNGRATGSIDFAPLASLTDRLHPGAVLAEYHIGGNLAVLRAELPVLPPLRRGDPVPPGPVLILSNRGLGSDPSAAFVARGLKVLSGRTLRAGILGLGYADAPTARFPVHYQLIGP